jgi:hypothetical protein
MLKFSLDFLAEHAGKITPMRLETQRVVVGNASIAICGRPSPSAPASLFREPFDDDFRLFFAFFSPFFSSMKSGTYKNQRFSFFKKSGCLLS